MAMQCTEIPNVPFLKKFCSGVSVWSSSEVFIIGTERNGVLICKQHDGQSIYITYSRQVRERLRVALERVSMLEDQLAASSQEVKFNLNDFLYFKDAQCEERIFICKLSVCPFCLPLSR